MGCFPGLKKYFPSKDAIAVVLEQDVLFLHPHSNSNAETDQPTDDPVLRGAVNIRLRRRRRLQSLKIKMVGIVTKHGGGSLPYETGECISKTLEIDLGNKIVEKGFHSYMFTFIIPTSTPVTERSPHGSIRHMVRAKCQYTNASSCLSWRKRLLKSSRTPFWLIANPSPPGEVPGGLELIIRDVGDDVGPVVFNISSANLTVSSLLYINIQLLSPPKMTIMSVTGCVCEMYSIEYDNRAIGVVAPKPKKRHLFYVDYTSPERADPPVPINDHPIPFPGCPSGASTPRGRFSRSRSGSTTPGISPIRDRSRSNTRSVYTPQTPGYTPQTPMTTSNPWEHVINNMEGSVRGLDESRSLLDNLGDDQERDITDMRLRRLNVFERGNVGPGSAPPRPGERRVLPKPFAELVPGVEWNYSRIVRIPNDDECRPTTLDGTKTPIRIKHKLLVEVVYKLEGKEKEMVLAMKSDISIASCCCLGESLFLPTYANAIEEEEKPLAAFTKPPFYKRCLCNLSLVEMIEQHGAPLLHAENLQSGWETLDSREQDLNRWKYEPPTPHRQEEEIVLPLVGPSGPRRPHLVV